MLQFFCLERLEAIKLNDYTKIVWSIIFVIYCSTVEFKLSFSQSDRLLSDLSIVIESKKLHNYNNTTGVKIALTYKIANCRGRLFKPEL